MGSLRHHWSTWHSSESHHLNIRPDSFITLISHFIFVIWSTSGYVPIGLVMNILQKTNEDPSWHTRTRGPTAHHVNATHKDPRRDTSSCFSTLTPPLDSPPRMSDSYLNCRVYISSPSLFNLLTNHLSNLLIYCLNWNHLPRIKIQSCSHVDWSSSHKDPIM